MSRRLDRSFFPWLIAHFFEFWYWYLGALVSLYALHRLQTQLPSEVKKLTDVAMTSGELPKAPVATFLLIALGILVFRTLSRLLFFTPARYQQKFLRTEMLELMEDTPTARYAAWNDGQLYQVIFNDFNSLRGFVGFSLLQVGNVIIAAWVMIPKLNEANPELWPAFIPMGVSVLIFSILTSTFQRYAKLALDAQGQVQNHVIESYAAKATVKNYHRENIFVRRFEELSKHELVFFFKQSVGFAFSIPLIRLGLGASLLWGAWILRETGAGTSDLVFFAGYLFLMLEPLMFLSWMVMVAVQGAAAWKRVKELYGAIQKPAVDEARWREEVREEVSELVFDVPYWESRLNIHIPKGKWTVLCGETGCGKSMLLKKFSERLKVSGLKSAMVQQEPYLFNDSIEANIFLGRVATAGEREKALRLLQLFSLEVLATNLESLLSLEVGENGKRLSGGQAKRLALVRSLMSEATVILWDDPFSSVDLLLERKILQTLKEEFTHKTFILTSHRHTTVKLCDQALLLSKTKSLSRDEGDLLEFFQGQMVATASS